MIDQLHDTMTRHAERVMPMPDPYTRILKRRRLRRQRMSTAFAVAALLVTTPAVLVAVGRGGADAAASKEPPAVLLPLLNSPTRGSLANDAAFLDRLRRRAANETNSGYAVQGQGPRMPEDPTMIKALFAGDLGGLRVAILAGMDDRPLQVTFQGKVGDAAEELVLSAVGVMEPLVSTGFAANLNDAARPYLIMGPAGAGYKVAKDRYTSDGIQRTWTDISFGDDYLGLREPIQPFRFRVVLDGQVLFERQVTEWSADQRTPTLTVDPQPALGRGKSMPFVADEAAKALSHLTGLVTPEVTYRVLWSDEIQLAGTSNGWAYLATVQAVTDDGGGPYYTLALDRTGPGATARSHPTGSGSAGDPQHALIAMRLPRFAAEPDGRLVVIAAPRAVRVDVVRAGKTVSADLVNGVGQLEMPLDQGVMRRYDEDGALVSEQPLDPRFIVRVFDAGGVLVAEKTFTDATSCEQLDPDSCPTR